MTSRQRTLVKSMRQEAEGIISVELVSASAGSLSPFTAGGHIDVFLKNDLVRQYSLMNDPVESDRYMFAVLLENDGRGGSAHIHKKLRVGDVIEVCHKLMKKKFKIGNNLFNLCAGDYVNILKLKKEILNYFPGKANLVRNVSADKADVYKTFGNNKKIRKILRNYKFKKIDYGLKKTINWFFYNSRKIKY